LETTVLRGIREDLFTAEGFVFFRQEVRRVLTERRHETRTQADRDQAVLRQIDTEIQNVLKAIKAGIWTGTTKSELESLEAEKARLLAQQPTRSAPPAVDVPLPRLEEQFRAAVASLTQLPESRIAEARQGLRFLFGGQPITLHPTADGGLEAELTGDYAGIVRLIGEEKLNNPGCGGLQSPTTFNINFLVDLV
jgi:hypothetical protein